MIDIKEMTKEHIEQVYEIEKICFSIPWSKKAFEDELNKNKMAIYIVALADEKVVGYGGMWHVINEGHITNVAVSPEYRRKGIGESLIKKLIEIAKEKEMIGLTLEVRISNEIAKNLYKKQGFLLDGIR
ncbi:MAG: ribosomal protein S18-alanine N-acetyltransferase, partial [Eubacteriales bacterium]|nr:ribosomal protein S18-alanine N-acetyltransferase [Eubacteriales bacterium]